MMIVTLLSLALAATMSLVAWRVVRDDRRRSEARIAALAAGIEGDGEPSGDELFAAPAPANSRLPIIGAAAIGLGVIATAGVLLTSSGSEQPVSAATTRTVSLALVALTHVRDGETLIIRGAVRNSANGEPMNRVTAIVLTLGAGGSVVSTTQAVVEPAVLRPGTEATFTATVPNAPAVERYRVSFRSDDRMVPHVDDRD